MKDIYNDIYEHIHEAYNEAIKRNIKVNQIIIDKGLAITNNLYFTNFDGSINESNPMMLGLPIVYQENLSKDGYNFILSYNPKLEQKTKTLADYTIQELFEELQKRAYIWKN